MANSYLRATICGLAGLLIGVLGDCGVHQYVLNPRREQIHKLNLRVRDNMHERQTDRLHADYKRKIGEIEFDYIMRISAYQKRLEDLRFGNQLIDELDRQKHERLMKENETYRGIMRGLAELLKEGPRKERKKEEPIPNEF